MARKKKQQPPPPGSPAWMATYGDMMSLLLTFFILLVSFSSIQESKFQEAVGSLKGAFGVMKDMPTVAFQQQVIRPTGRTESVAGLNDKLDSFKEGIESIKKGAEVKVSRTETGLAIRLDEKALFDLGRAELRPEAAEILEQVAAILIDLPAPIRVQGHTDDLPISTERFPSNWELSAARAISVLRFLEGAGIDPRRLQASGFGEWRPVVRNDTPEHRQMNRRVEIFMDLPREERELRLGDHL